MDDTKRRSSEILCEAVSRWPRMGAALWGGGGRRAGRRSCGITPISVIGSSAVAGEGAKWRSRAR